MVLYYDEKIENKKLGYCLYLDLKENKEYWHDSFKDICFETEEAGDLIIKEVVFSLLSERLS